MKVKDILYKQGSATVPEDGFIFQPPRYFGAIDGTSGVYPLGEGARLFKGRTGGQLASSIVSHAFGAAIPGQSLEDILQKANCMLREIIQKSKISLQESGLLPSAAFVAAEISNSDIDIIQGGDCLAVWQMEDGALGATPNKVFSYEEHLLSTIANLMKKHEGDRKKMWKEFSPILIKERRDNFNTEQGGFGILNGQPGSEKFWQRFILPREETKLLILFSDGLVPFEWSEQELIMAERITSLYEKGGLHFVLENTRKIADLKKSSSHEDYPEATAIAIEF